MTGRQKIEDAVERLMRCPEVRKRVEARYNPPRPGIVTRILTGEFRK